MHGKCEVCGNMSEVSTPVCPFCGHRTEKQDRRENKPFVHKTVNLEEGRPAVELALHRMTELLEDGARNGVTAVTLIHGYGSSGKGGVIRLESRKMLDYMKSRGKIADFIFGEEFTGRSRRVKSLLRRYPRLSSDKNLNKGNRGITLVII
jgi:uncharacterized Zn finger protein (UPF0148 family)